nr:hypothetical protein [Cellulosimicrobium sp. MM]
MAGARFRGVVPDGVVAPGELRLAEGARVVGPFALTRRRRRRSASRAGAPRRSRSTSTTPTRGSRPAGTGAWADTSTGTSTGSVTDDRDGLVRAFPAGLPQGLELRVLGWAVAAARRVGGAVVADGRTVLTPDPASGVDLTLYSAHVLGPDDALGVLRTTVPGAGVVGCGRRGRPRGVRAVGRDPVRRRGAARGPTRRAGPARARRPRLARARAARLPPHVGADRAGELAVERPSGLHVIARSRARVLLARLAAMLQGRLAGTLVDDGGLSCATSTSTSGSPRRRHPRRGSGSEPCARAARGVGRAGPRRVCPQNSSTGLWAAWERRGRPVDEPVVIRRPNDNGGNSCRPPAEDYKRP